MVASIWTLFMSLMNRQADITWPWSIRITSVPCRRTKFAAEPSRTKAGRSCLDVPDLFLHCCHYLNLFASYSSTVSNEKCFEKRNFLLRRSIKTHWRYMFYHWNIRATFPLIFPAVSMVFHLHLNSCIKLSSSHCDYTATRYRDFWAKRTGTSCT